MKIEIKHVLLSIFNLTLLEEIYIDTEKNILKTKSAKKGIQSAATTKDHKIAAKAENVINICKIKTKI